MSWKRPLSVRRSARAPLSTRVRRLLLTLVSAVVIPPSVQAATVDDGAPFQAACSDAAALRTHWQASAFATWWAHPTLAGLRARLTKPGFAWPWGGLSPVLGDFTHARVAGSPTADGSWMWNGEVAQPGVDPRWRSLAGGAWPGTLGIAPDLTWSLAWRGPVFTFLRGGAVPDCLPPAVALPAPDVWAHLEPARIAALGDEPQSAAFFTACGLTRLDYELTFTTAGCQDRLMAPGWRAPCATLAAADLADLPAQAWAAMAFACDGRRLSALLHDLRRVPEVEDALALYALRGAQHFGPIDELVGGLDGAVVVASVPGTPFPDLIVSTPATPGWDRLLTGVCALGGIDPDAPHRAPALMVLPVAWPSTLWLHRDAAHWRIATALQLVDAPAPAATAPLPGLSAGLGAAGVIALDVAALAPAMLRYCALLQASATQGHPQTPAVRERIGAVRDVIAALIDRPLPVQAVLHCVGSGTSLDGEGAAIAAVLPFAAAVIGTVETDHAVDAWYEDRARQGLLAVAALAGAPGGAWSDACPALATAPVGGHRLAGEPWLRYVPPAADAAPDQPLAITSPRYLHKRMLWLCRDGHVASGSVDLARPLWETAGRLAARGGRAGPTDWATILRDYRRASGHRQLFASADFNYSGCLPGGDWRPFVDKDTTPARRIWMRKDDQVGCSVVTDQLSRDDDQVPANLLESMLEHLRGNDPALVVLWQGDVRVDGLPARRARVRTHGGGVDLIYDLTALASHGFTYQLYVWSAPRTIPQEQLVPIADDLLADFSVEDHARSAPILLAASEQLTSVALPRMPWRFAVAGLGWSRVAAKPDDNAAIESKFVHHATGTFAFVASAALVGQPSDQALAAGLLDLVHVDYAAGAVRDERRIALPAGRGLAMRYTFTDKDGKADCRAWTMIVGGRALVVVCATPAGTDADAIGDALLASLGPDEAARPQPPASDPACDRAFAAAVGRYYKTKKRFVDALPWLRATLPASGAEAVELEIEVLTCYVRLERWREGLDWFTAQVGSSDDLALASYQPFLLEQLGEHAQAAALYRPLFAAGWKDADDFAQYVTALRAAGGATAGEAAFAEFPALATSLAGAQLHARLLREDGQDDAAVAELRAATGRAARDAAAAAALADLELDLERPAAAREDLAQAVVRLPRSARLRHLLGVADYRLDRFHEAADEFRKELELDPTAKSAREFLEAIDRQLGKGDTSRLATPIAAVPGIAEEAVPALAGHPPGGAYLLRAAALSWTPEQGFHHSERRVVAITDRAACESWSTINLYFDPALEDFFVNRLTVRDEQGRILAEGRRDDWYVADEQDGPIAGTAKVAHLPVPGLRPGCVIDLLTTRARPTGDGTPPFTLVRLAGPHPTQRAVVTVTASAGALELVTGGGLQQVAGAPGSTRVEAQDLPATLWEPLVPEDPSDLPVVWVGPHSGTWATLAGVYLAELAPFLGDDAALTAIARAQVAGVEGVAGRIRVLADYVQRTVAYSALEFGRRGRIPQPASRTLERRLGDCKDQAVLLQRLLAAAGVTAHLALVPGGHLIDGLPDLDQFNHMVVVAEQDGRMRLLDPTAKQLDLELVPPHEADRPLLLLDARAPRVITAPPAGEDRIAVMRTIAIAADGALSGSEDVDLSGYTAAHWRSECAGQDDSARCRRLQDALGAGLILDRLTVAGLDDVHQPLHLHLEYRLRDGLQHVAGRLAGRIPDVWCGYRWAWAAQQSGERQRPFARSCAMVVTVTTTCRSATGVPQLRAQVPADDDGVMAFSEKLAPGAQPVLRQSFTLSRGTAPPAAYRTWCQRLDVLLHRAALEVEITSP